MKRGKFTKITTAVLALALIVPVLAAYATGQPYPRVPRWNQGRPGQGMPGRGMGSGRELTLPDEVTAFKSLSVVLGRPTAESITASVLTQEAKEAFIEYGEQPGAYTSRTDTVKLPAGEPVDTRIGGLRADTQYYYRVRYRGAGQGDFLPGPEQSFHTQRAPGSVFIFDVQADSHPERLNRQFSEELYARELGAAATDMPDFYITLGDDFSVDERAQVTAETVKNIYYNQRLFLSMVAGSAPLFLVTGNHEELMSQYYDGTANNAVVWSLQNRDKYFPQPGPNGFYTGNEDEVANIGLLRDYYAWTWGDALFVVIDPYWYTGPMSGAGYGRGPVAQYNWNLTLGDEQYEWLKQTLEQSDAKYKFVFAHHVLGNGRGGVEMANLYEWGGENLSGVNEFAGKRPGWEMPIHKLMAENGVTIFFQGHDHLFAKEELDGVIYQEVPSPADPNYNHDHAYAYKSGVVLPSSGRLRVTVSDTGVKVEYVRSYLPKDETGDHPDGEIAYTYTVK